MASTALVVSLASLALSIRTWRHRRLADRTYCWCGRPATESVPIGMVGDTPLDLLVCKDHVRSAPDA